MTGTSAGGIILIMAVVLVGAMAMILWIFVVGGRGSFKHRRIDHRAGDVRGGIHLGDPGSVMPRRDAPANSVDPDATGPDKPLGLVRPASVRREPATLLSGSQQTRPVKEAGSSPTRWPWGGELHLHAAGLRPGRRVTQGHRPGTLARPAQRGRQLAGDGRAVLRRPAGTAGTLRDAQGGPDDLLDPLQPRLSTPGRATRLVVCEPGFRLRLPAGTSGIVRRDDPPAAEAGRVCRPPGEGQRGRLGDAAGMPSPAWVSLLPSRLAGRLPGEGYRGAGRRRVAKAWAAAAGPPGGPAWSA